MKPHSRQKLAAYKRHWHRISAIQDEMWTQYIHEGLRLKAVQEEAQLAHATVARFFHRGKGNGKTSYSMFHGPTLTTVIGIAGAIGMEIVVQKSRATREAEYRRIISKGKKNANSASVVESQK